MNNINNVQQACANADHVVLYSLMKLVLLQRKPGPDEVKKHAKGQCGLALDRLSNTREALGLSPVPQERRKEKGERARARGREGKGGEGEGGSEGGRKETCLSS